VAGVEVLTLFSEQSFTSLTTQNTTLVNEINRRVGSDQWYVGVDIIDWRRQPNYRDVAKRLRVRGHATVDVRRQCMTAPGEQPGNQGVGVPHLAGTQFIAPQVTVGKAGTSSRTCFADLCLC
jgi:hypothetical protein